MQKKKKFKELDRDSQNIVYTYFIDLLKKNIAQSDNIVTDQYDPNRFYGLFHSAYQLLILGLCAHNDIYDIVAEGNYPQDALKLMAECFADYSGEELLLEPDMWEGRFNEVSDLQEKYKHRLADIVRRIQTLSLTGKTAPAPLETHPPIVPTAALTSI